MAISQISLTVFQRQLKLSNIDIDLLLGDNVEKNGIAFSKIDNQLINEIKCHWRDKGDFLSR